jgi:uncharacterized protein
MAMPRSNEPLPPSLLAWRECIWLYCANGLLSVFFILGYIANCSGNMQDFAAFCLPLAAVSYAFCLNLVPAIASVPFYFFMKKRWVARTISVLLYAALQIALLSDVILFRMFHLHFDKPTWLMLTSDGAGETIIIGFWNWVVIIILILLLMVVSCCLGYRFAPKISRHGAGGMILLMAVCIFADKAVFAYCDLKEPATVYWLREYLPLYPSVSLQGLASYMGWKTRIESRPDMGPPDNLEMNLTLDLPKKPVGFGETMKRPNILYLLVDSARADALRPEVMPDLWAWKDEALWLTNHYSTGHATREGVFGSLYGLPANYLPYAARQQRGAPLLDVLLGLNYDMEILSCTPLSFPLCKLTIFCRVTNKITDEWPCAREGRDRAMTDEFLHFLKKRNAPDSGETAPFFGFLFFDASHLPYYCPKELQLHPADEATPNINYAHYLVDPSASKEAMPYYENGLHYVDSQIARVIGELKAENIYDNTIIIVAGDHGEEFGEHGHFGHGNAFTPGQTQPLCVVHFPGWAPGVSARMTSSVDFVPSILNWMGATNETSDYSTGCVLNQDNDRTFVLCSDRKQCALIKRDRITLYDPHLIQVFDGNYNPVNAEGTQSMTGKEWHEAARQRTYYFK